MGKNTKPTKKMKKENIFSKNSVGVRKAYTYNGIGVIVVVEAVLSEGVAIDVAHRRC